MKESARYLRISLNEAYPGDHDEAPLFALLHGYDPEERQHGAMSRRSAFQRLAATADAAGVERERAQPHNLRKSAVVRMRLNHDISRDAVQKRMKWSNNVLLQMNGESRARSNEDEIKMVAREFGWTARHSRMRCWLDWLSWSGLRMNDDADVLGKTA